MKFNAAANLETAAPNPPTAAAALAPPPPPPPPRLRVPTEFLPLNFSLIHKCQGCTAISPTSTKLLGNSKRPGMGT